MTNNYVPDLSQLGSGDIARSQDVNDRYENTVAGFDRLPEPKVGEQGFSAPTPVGEPVNSDHAATKNFVETGVTSQVVIAEGYKDDAAASAAAALASEQAADASETVALNQAGIATTKASEASTSAANALASENAAASSETAAGLSEAAADADRIAAQSAKTDAETAKTAAEAAQTAAELAYDSFDDRYLGPKAADPTVDNDGNALLTGALYFDTNNDDMKVYNGSNWVVAYIPPESLTLQEVTDNGATTNAAVTFSGSLTASNASVNLTSLGTTTSTTDPVLMITAAGLVEKKTLGSNAFNSNTYDNYQGWQLNGGTSTEAIGKNETVTFVGSGGASVTNSGNTVTINSTDTNTTNFNIQANSGTATNISAGETVNFTGSGGISVTRSANSFTIDGSSAGITDVVSDTTPQLGGTLDANGNIIDMGVNTITDAKVGQWDAAYGDKVNTVGFDTGTGILTLNRQDGGTVTKDLDGRYVVSSFSVTNANTGSTIVSRDANGDSSHRYLNTSYVNMSHSSSTRSSETIFYSSTDNFIRKNNATGFRASLNVPTRTGGDASGTWGISITGNAGSATDASTLGGASASDGASTSTIVKRTSGGYIFANYFNTTPNDIADGSVTSFCAESGNDGYIRHVKASGAHTFLETGITPGSISTEHNLGSVNYVYNVAGGTPTRGDCSTHVYQVWSANLALTLTSTTWQVGDIVVVSNAKGTQTAQVTASRIYMPNGSFDTVVTLNNQVGSFRLAKYTTTTGYWMVLP